MPVWLPSLLLLNDYSGDWNKYLAALYDAFVEDFMPAPKFQFSGKNVNLKRHPIEGGKEATFWHFISTGSVEADRTPDFRRCERIKWVRAMMENHQDPAIKSWQEVVNKDLRIHLWCEEAAYLVIIADRGQYVLPWTAYPIEQPHRARKLNRRYEENKN